MCFRPMYLNPPKTIGEQWQDFIGKEQGRAPSWFNYDHRCICRICKIENDCHGCDGLWTIGSHYDECGECRHVICFRDSPIAEICQADDFHPKWEKSCKTCFNFRELESHYSETQQYQYFTCPHDTLGKPHHIASYTYKCDNYA